MTTYFLRGVGGHIFLLDSSIHCFGYLLLVHLVSGLFYVQIIGENMTHYLVSRSIDIDADSCEQAADMALAMQRDRSSTATVFDVEDVATGKSKLVDNYPIDEPK